MLLNNETSIRAHHKSEERKVKEQYERGERSGFSLELDMTLTSAPNWNMIYDRTRQVWQVGNNLYGANVPKIWLKTRSFGAHG